MKHEEDVNERLQALLAAAPNRRAEPSSPRRGLPETDSDPDWEPEPELVREQPVVVPAVEFSDDDSGWAGRLSNALFWLKNHLSVLGIVLLGVCLSIFYASSQVHSAELGGSAEVPAASMSSAGSASASAQEAGETAAAPSSDEDLRILVHVLGAVKNPGVVSLPVGSRVLDALKTAGGLKKDADTAELNYASVLNDGDQVIVGTKKEPRGEIRAGQAGGAGVGGSGAAGSDAAVLVSLNQATSDQLETLPGVGPALAAKIIAYRDENGGFTEVRELLQVSGIGEKKYAEIAPLVTL
ncbi:MAG: helix-hairpin-helix domain-containing protein [Propionibacteriaceae bacterium]|nr:helix-hairpin-helix domain-containing protein [Propionibacteriaceae bacterium]